MMTSRKDQPAYVIQVSRIEESPGVDVARLETLVVNILKHFEVTTAHVDIAIVDDATIQEVHAEYLDDPTTTDVISFDLSDDPQEPCLEIVVNESQAAREAAQRGIPPASEVALYITHGMLHHLGYDDLEPEAAEAMHRKEDELLEQNGFGTVYHKSE